MGSRSRPPTLLTCAHRLVRDARLFGRGELVLCACSGGPDSTALLHALALLRRRVGHELCAVGVDHGLRPAASAELEIAARVARAERVPFATLSLALVPGPGVLERARRARHEALQAHARKVGAVVMALGHTSDDRAETVLMRLLRGSGPRGLAVMPPRSRAPYGGAADLVRPLLGVRRTDVIGHLERHGLPWAEDPTNRDMRFLRSQVRWRVLPLLEELSPGIVGHLCALADMLAGERTADPLAGLGRAQRAAVARAVALGRRSATVRVSGGRDLAIAFSGGPPVIADEQ